MLDLLGMLLGLAGFIIFLIFSSYRHLHKPEAVAQRYLHAVFLRGGSTDMQLGSFHFDLPWCRAIASAALYDFEK